eukprot:jgi/Botrbrau1/21946/Bobra.0249s0069.1
MRSPLATERDPIQMRSLLATDGYPVGSVGYPEGYSCGISLGHGFLATLRAFTLATEISVGLFWGTCRRLGEEKQHIILRLTRKTLALRLQAVEPHGEICPGVPHLGLWALSYFWGCARYLQMDHAVGIKTVIQAIRMSCSVRFVSQY